MEEDTSEDMDGTRDGQIVSDGSGAERKTRGLVSYGLAGREAGDQCPGTDVER